MAISDAKSESTVQRKWSRDALKTGFTMLPTVFIVRQRQLGLHAIDVNILLHLIASWWEKDIPPRLSKKTIAKRMGVDPSTIQRRVRAMETAGFVKRIRRFGSNKSTQ